MTTVNTVLGEISSGDLGVVLMHEHLYANNSGWWHCPSCSKRIHCTNIFPQSQEFCHAPSQIDHHKMGIPHIQQTYGHAHAAL